MITADTGSVIKCCDISLSLDTHVTPIVVLMNKCRAILVVAWVLCVSCQDDESVNKAVFTTSEVTRTTEGAVFQGNVAILDDVPYDNYGFVWSENNEPTLSDSVFFFDAAPLEGKFSTEVKNDLEKGSVYNVRAFIKAKNTVYYGNTVKFESLGSATPVVTGFDPNHGGSLDTIKISGENFSRLVSNLQVKIGQAECQILSASREELTVRLPEYYTAGSFPVEVTVSGKSGISKNTFELDGPTIKSISPDSGPAGTLVTLTGVRFSAERSRNVVHVGEYRASIVSASPTTLVIEIPQFAVVSSKDISIEVDLAKYVAKDAFKLTGPKITSVSPSSGIQGSVVTIKGTGFSTVPAENEVYLRGGIAAEVLSASAEELVVKVPWATTAGTSDCSITVRGAFELSEEKFTILGPEVTRIEPAQQYGGRTIKLIGKNFKADPHLTQVYFFGTNLVANIDNLTDTEMDLTIPLQLNDNSQIVVSVGGIHYMTTFEFQVLSPWVKQADFPGVTRYGAVGFSIGQYGYVGTGVTDNGDLRDLWRFDSNNHTWKRMKDYPGPSRAFSFSFVVDGKAYVGGGGHYGTSSYDFLFNLYDLWEYDPSTDSWTQKASLSPNNIPSGTMATATAVGRYGYFAVNGWMRRYNVDTDVWDAFPSQGTINTIIASAQNKVYMTTRNFDGGLIAYDPATSSWSSIAGTGNTSWSITSFAIDDKVYMGSGDRFNEYDPATSQWKSLPTFSLMPGYPATFTIGSVGYCVTGQGGGSFATFDPHY